jgi:hypothetical protein
MQEEPRGELLQVVGNRVNGRTGGDEPAQSHSTA